VRRVSRSGFCFWLQWRQYIIHLDGNNRDGKQCCAEAGASWLGSEDCKRYERGARRDRIGRHHYGHGR
jgi:hypothetical protein